jgi:hypothetical protein
MPTGKTLKSVSLFPLPPAAPQMDNQKLPSPSFHSYSKFSRSALGILLGLSALVSLSLFYDFRAITITGLQSIPENVTPDRNYPPAYKKLRKWIHDLPQHNLSLPFPEGKDGRYVKFSCQVQELGWNNMLNELYVGVSSSYRPRGLNFAVG